jgi:hypothetical protein
LFSRLTDHEIWQDAVSWRECINDIVTMKVEDSVRRRKHKPIGEHHQEKSFLKKGFNSIKGFITSNKTQKEQELKANQNLIFNEMSRFVQSFINFGLAYEPANKLLIHFCDKF